MLTNESNHCYEAVARTKGILFHKELATVSSCDYRNIVEFQKEMFEMYENVEVLIYQKF